MPGLENHIPRSDTFSGKFPNKLDSPGSRILPFASVEEIRSLFDDGGVGLVLIGMPVIEKRMERPPQLYSRIRFVHEFEPLDSAEMKALLHRIRHPAELRPQTAPYQPGAVASPGMLRGDTGKSQHDQRASEGPFFAAAFWGEANNAVTRGNL